jgi:hypothetical protein
MLFKRAITLLELLIAISLLLLIVLGVGVFDIASRRFLRSSETKVSVVNDLAYILEHINKYISLATGDINVPGIVLPDSTHLRIRVDLNNPPTPNNYTDDTWLEYRLNGHNLEFCSNFNITTNRCRTSYEILSSKLVETDSFSFSQPQINQIVISGLKLRYKPSKPVDSSQNPEVGIYPATITFTSLSHSIN